EDFFPLDAKRPLVARLLHDMRQFMCKQPLPIVCLWRELARAKHNVVAHRVGAGIHVARRLRGRRIAMDPHLAEIAPEGWLKKAARGGIGRLTRRAESLMDAGRCLAASCERPRRLRLKSFLPRRDRPVVQSLLSLTGDALAVLQRGCS